MCDFSEEIMGKTDKWTAPLFLLFFVLSGALGSGGTEYGPGALLRTGGAEVEALKDSLVISAPFDKE